MAYKARKTAQSLSDLSGRVEQLAEQLLDVCAEERRLLKTLARLRSARSALISALAEIASTIRDAEHADV